MSPDTPKNSAPAPEKQLCLSCTTPNEPVAHFCIKCGAALSSYASTAPFESRLATGSLFRQATERPRRFIVVLGMWMICGAMAVAGVILVSRGHDRGLLKGSYSLVLGALLLVVSLTMVLKTTRNYFAKRHGDRTGDA